MNGSTTITINGQQVGLKFAYPAVKWFAEALVDDDGILFTKGEDGGFTVEGLAKLIQFSHKNYCLIKEIEPKLTYEDFYDYVETQQETEEGQKELIRITEVYAEANVMKKLLNGQKKNLTSQ